MINQGKLLKILTKTKMLEKDQNPKEEHLRFENELKKLKLKAEYGADFHSGDRGELPANVESQWLDNIMAFEKSFQKNEVSKVRDLLGKPALPSGETLSDKKLTEALDHVMELLAAKSIALDTIYEVPDRELYRFITEELMEYEMQAIDVPGMVTHFTYEEFHPNDEEDMKRYVREFVELVMEKRFEFMHYEISSQMIYRGKTLSGEEFVKQFSGHMADIERLTLRELTVPSPEIEGDKATVKCVINYEKRLKAGTVSDHKGEAVFGFEYQYDYWHINQVLIPGLGF